MEYQKITKLLHNTPNQPSKSSIKNLIGINYDSHETYNTNSQIKFKMLMLNPSLYGYSDAHILVSGTITVVGAE